MDAACHTGDWRKLFAAYQSETVSLTAPAAVYAADVAEGACILTPENMHTEGDCTLHEHEPAVPEEEPSNILPFIQPPTAAESALERLRRAAQRK